MYSAHTVCKFVDIGGKRASGETGRFATRELLSAETLSRHSLSPRVLVEAYLLKY